MEISVSDQVSDTGDPMLEGEAVKSGLFFDPGLETANEEILAFTADALEVYERQSPPRQRKRREADQMALEALLRAVYANLAAALINGTDTTTVAVGLAKPTAKLSRYDDRGQGQLGTVLDVLHAAGLLVLIKSRKVGTASSIEANAAFKQLVAGLRLDWSAFRQSGEGETIILSATENEDDFMRRRKVRVDYIDTDDSHRLRSEMRRINEALKAADIGFRPDNHPLPHVHKRALRRYFKAPQSAAIDGKAPFAPDGNGRLFGAWWENLDRGRRIGILLEGAPIADLDFSAMFLRLAYLRAGHTPPDGDLYQGILADDPEGRYRDGVKIVVNAMLSRTGPLKRLPKDAKGELPPKATARSLRAAILSRHPLIAHVFEMGLGATLMRTESDVLVSCLLTLIDRGITALPMHDGVMVHPRHADQTAAIMGDVSEALLGVRLLVKRKDPSTV